MERWNKSGFARDPRMIIGRTGGGQEFANRSPRFPSRRIKFAQLYDRIVSRLLFDRVETCRGLTRIGRSFSGGSASPDS